MKLPKILEKLKEIVNVNINLSRFINVEIKIVDRPESKEKLSGSSDDKNLLLNFSALEKEEKEKLKPLFKEIFEKDEDQEINIVEENSFSRVKDIKRRLNSETAKSILEFYKDKISEKHYKALEASVYLRQVFESNGSISELKRDIIHKFGEEGKNICNLCTSAYFESYFKELYNEMAKASDFSNDKYKEYFERIIASNPFAIFVHSEMSEDEISGEITYKLDTYKKYGIKFLDIHGIGKNNVSKIMEIVKALEDDKSLKIAIYQQSSIILVRIALD